MINKLTGNETQTRDEVIDVFTCCNRHVHETPQGIFDDATDKRHECEIRLPDELVN